MKFIVWQVYSNNYFPFDIAARLIRFFQKTNYSHYIIETYNPETGEVSFYDSTAMGVRERTYTDITDHYFLMKSFPLDKKLSYIDWLEFWAEHNNKGYGFVQILGLLLKTFRIVKNNPFGKGAKRIICNELVILLLNRLGYTNIQDTDSLDLNDTDELLRGIVNAK